MLIQSSYEIRASKLNIRVFIIEPDYFARQWLKLLIARDRRTRVFGTAAKLALTQEQQAQLSQADIVLLDHSLLERHGDALMQFQKFRIQAPRAKILLLCAHSSNLAPGALLTAGAAGILVKDEVCDSVASAIERAYREHIVITSSVKAGLDALPWQVQERVDLLPHAAHFDELTGRLLEPIFLFAVGGMEKEQIADERQVALNTVRKYLADAYQILSASNSWDAFERLTALEDELDEQANESQ